METNCVYIRHIYLNTNRRYFESDIRLTKSFSVQKTALSDIQEFISFPSFTHPILGIAVEEQISFLFRGHEPIYFTENKEKTLRVSYDRDTHTIEYMN